LIALCLYTYWRCKDSSWDIIVRWDGFDAQDQLRTQHNQASRRGLAGEL